MKTLLEKEKHGVALAAPQVGEPLRIFVISERVLNSKEHEKEEIIDPETPLIYINPEVVRTSRLKRKKHEGCLSIRGKWGVVPRTEKMTIRAYNEHGQLFTRGASGFLAHIFQHEMDHLDGILYIDKATELYDEEAQEDTKTA